MASTSLITCLTLSIGKVTSNGTYALPDFNAASINTKIKLSLLPYITIGDLSCPNSLIKYVAIESDISSNSL